MRRTIFILLVFIWIFVSFSWIKADRLLRDGDEEGHVGAAELIVPLWDNPLNAVVFSLKGDLGDYPPLYASIVSIPWKISKETPESVWIRGINIFWPLLSSLSIFLITKNTKVREFAFLFTLTIPLLTGLGRHYMPEGALAAFVSLFAYGQFLSLKKPEIWKCVFAGVFFGLALLIKQTALFLTIPVFLATILVSKKFWPSFLSALIGIICFLPWFIPHLDSQLQYGTESLGELQNAFSHLVFYPKSIILLGAGPFVTLLFVLSVSSWKKFSPKERELLKFGLIWLLATILILTLIPRKYPRLYVTALPSMTLVGAIAYSHFQKLSLSILGASFIWLCLMSWYEVPFPNSVMVVDDRCPQRWIRPPGQDLGLKEAISIVEKSRPGPIAVVGTIAIPCDIQSTHNWEYHLGPALRRSGNDREFTNNSNEATVIFYLDQKIDGLRNFSVLDKIVSVREL